MYSQQEMVGSDLITKETRSVVSLYVQNPRYHSVWKNIQIPSSEGDHGLLKSSRRNSRVFLKLTRRSPLSIFLSSPEFRNVGISVQEVRSNSNWKPSIVRCEIVACISDTVVWRKTSRSVKNSSLWLAFQQVRGMKYNLQADTLKRAVMKCVSRVHWIDISFSPSTRLSNIHLSSISHSISYTRDRTRTGVSLLFSSSVSSSIVYSFNETEKTS